LGKTHCIVSVVVPVAAPTVAVIVKVACAVLEKETAALPVAVTWLLGVNVPPTCVVEKLTVVLSLMLVTPSGFLTVAVMATGVFIAAAVGTAATDTIARKGTTALPEALPAEAFTVNVPGSTLVRVTKATPPAVVAVFADRLEPAGVAEKETSVPSATGVPSGLLTVAEMSELPATGGVADTTTDAGALGSVVGNHLNPLPHPASMHTVTAVNNHLI
jgi:hypothetical protein